MLGCCSLPLCPDCVLAGLWKVLRPSEAASTCLASRSIALAAFPAISDLARIRSLRDLVLDSTHCCAAIVAWSPLDPLPSCSSASALLALSNTYKLPQLACALDLEALERLCNRLPTWRIRRLCYTVPKGACAPSRPSSGAAAAVGVLSGSTNGRTTMGADAASSGPS